MEAGTSDDSHVSPAEVPDVPVVPNPHGSLIDEPETSVLDALRERRRQIADPDSTVTLQINGYGGTLLARYRKIPLRDVVEARKKISKRNPDETTGALTLAANVLVDACQAFLAVTEPGAEPVELQTTAEQLGEDPIRYEPRLALALAFEDKLAALNRPPRAVDVVRFTFENTYALFAHFNAYDEWLKDTTTEADESF